MSENGIAKILKLIGIIEIICSIILGFIAFIDYICANWIGAVVMLTGFITGMVFIGFSEIINLLQQNVDKQNAMLAFLSKHPAEEKEASQSVLQDIEPK